MKAGWQRKRLEEVCQFSNGLWKGEKPPFVNVGVIRNTNFTKEGTLDDSDIAYLDVEANKFEKRRLQYGDVILEKSGGGPKQPVGRVVLFDKTEGDFSFSNFTSALRVLDPDSLDFRFLHKFLYWTYLSGVTEGMQSHSTGIRNLDGYAYKAIEISFPKLPEQQRIVGILGEAFDGIATARANTEKNLQNARALFESHLNSVFTQRGEGWQNVALAEACEMFADGDWIESKDQFPTGIRLIQTGNVGRGEFKNRTEKARYISEATFKRLRCTEIFEGDCLVSRLPNPVGRSCLLPNTGDRMITAVDCTILRFKRTHVIPSFFVYYSQSQDYLRAVNSETTGTTRNRISRNNLGHVAIPLAPIANQIRIGATLGSLLQESKRLESIYQQKLAALDELKKSLLHEAFNGEL